MTRSSEQSSPDASIPASWRKSSYSGGESGACLEVNDASPARVPVRDSKVPHGPALLFGAPAWAPFITGVKSGTLAR